MSRVGTQALVHLAWHRCGETRDLVFGWIEMLPACFPLLEGHPFKRHPIARRGPFLHVARFPMEAAAARSWFAAAAVGNLVLPAFPGHPTPGDGKPLGIHGASREPAANTASTALWLPFLPKAQATVVSEGLFGEPAACVKLALADGPSREWLSRMLFFDLNDHSEYLGGLFQVGHQPVIRDVSSRRRVRALGEAELVRIRRWPGTEFTGHHLLAVERRPLGYGMPVEREVTSELTEIVHGPKQDRTAVAVLHPEHGICWFREPQPWLRTITTSIEPVGAHRRIVQEVDETGVAKRYFDVPIRDASGVQSVIGDVPDHRLPGHREAQSAAGRAATAAAAAMGLRWFDEPSAAQQAIREIIGTARRSLSIFDPYFGPLELRDFAMAVQSGGVAVTVVTSADGLSMTMPGDVRSKKEDVIEDFLGLIRKDAQISPELYVMAGAGQLHDRFIEADGRLWLSGNSLNAIGAKASMLIEIPNSADVLSRLAPFRSGAKPFADWIRDRRAARADGGALRSGADREPDGTRVNGSDVPHPSDRESDPG